MKMKVKKIENKFIDLIENRIDIIIFCAVLILSLLIRVFFIKYKSADYKLFLKPWFYELKDGGGLKALANYPGDYNAPYMTVLALLTYIKVNPLISIKCFSILFDYILAILAGLFVYDVKKDSKNRKTYFVVSFCLMLFSPTILLNGSLWAQCDVIYTTFLVLAFYLLYKDKNTMSFISLGLAFSFKLQFIFIIPVFIILYFRKKNFSILNFLIIPITNIVLCIPAIIAGKPILECLTVYLRQTSTYNSLTLNFPNIYEIFNGNIDYLSKFGMMMVIILFILMFYFCIKKKIKFNLVKTILLAIWSIVICVFFLPCMHERYMFAADVFSILYFLLYGKKAIYMIIINFISLLSYFRFLFGDYILPGYLVSIVFFCLIVHFTIELKNKLNDRELKDEK